MQVVTIQEKKRTAAGWKFQVELESDKDTAQPEYTVKLTEDYYQQLTNGGINPEDLVEKSFYYLLEREPANSIMSEFNLSDISTYFPNYESEILSWSETYATLKV